MLQVIVHATPVYADVFVHEDVPKACQRRELARKLGGQYTQLAHLQDGVIVIRWLASALQRDDPVADVNAALRGDLEVSLDNVAQKGVPVKLAPCLALQRP